MKLTGARIVWEMLRREGVEVVFGIPGGAIMHTYHPRQEYGIRHILVRHEQCAAHAADGYARVSDRVGVAIATSGPGATNLVTGIANAMLDSAPMVCITGQVPTSLLGSDAFQEVDITGITLPITKHNYLVTDVSDLAGVIHEAFYIARSGRPGPVLVDLPKDVQIAETEFVPPEGDPQLPGYCSVPSPSPSGMRQAAALINGAKRPVILAGHGVMMSGATETLHSFVEKTETPVALTLLGMGAFPQSHRLSLGLMGMHGEAPANHAIQHSDLLLAFGMRFDDRVTGTLDTYAPQARKVHIDLDAAELNKVVPVDVAIEGDLCQVLEQLLPLVDQASHQQWLEQIEEWQGETQTRDILNQSAAGRVLPAHVVNAIWKASEGEAIVVTDVGQHQMWAAQYYPLDDPNALVTSGGLGTMGFGLPAAIGAQVARPDKEIWAFVGDGGLQMTIQELATVVQEKLPLRIALFNNGYLGMVRQWQEFFYEQRYESTCLANPDFVQLAQAYGIPAWRVTDAEQTRQAIAEARDQPGPAFIDFQIEQMGEGGNVYPMVPAGKPLQDMIRRPHTGDSASQEQGEQR